MFRRAIRSLPLVVMTHLLGCARSVAPEPPSAPPVADGSTVRAVELALGWAHTCARLDDGSVRCWGWNAMGQLGDGTMLDRATPTRVALAAPATHLVAGQDHTCARLSDGSLACWGDNSTGALGALGPPSVATPRALATDQPVVQLALGAGFTCALLVNHAVDCWGNDNAVCGSPWALAPTGLVALVPTRGVACGVDAHGVYSCWYASDPSVFAPPYGCASDGPAVWDVDNPLVAAYEYPAQPIAADATAVALGASLGCALRRAGSVECWTWTPPMRRLDGMPTTPTTVAGLPVSPRALAVGWDHACALAADGSVWCWGRGDGGQLGDGATVDRAVAVRVVGLDHVTSVAAGGAHSCAIDGDGAVWCWGANQNGRLGDGTTVNRPLPVRVAW